MITISEELKGKMPEMVLGVVSCKLKNTASSPLLWDEINNAVNEIRSTYTIEEIAKQDNIAATRRMYLACGKKPGRYRPSAEALLRRIVKGEELYRISTLVDLINLISIKSGYSIGGFDADKIVGTISAGIGKENEKFNAIGRGDLNIAGLPILRDEAGPIGTPTSDEERTSVSMGTSSFLMNINAYRGTDGLQTWLQYSEILLKQYCQASDIKIQIV